MPGDCPGLGLERPADDRLVFRVRGVRIPLALGRRAVAVDAAEPLVHRVVVRVRGLLEERQPKGLDEVEALLALEAERLEVRHGGVLLQVVGGTSAGDDRIEALPYEIRQNGIHRRPEEPHLVVGAPEPFGPRLLCKA